ncbi:MAG: hypothetical protein IJS52_06825 [Bacilli bacterium]|nr:hypothetical protein [Bacilli bacterium]
MKNKSKTIAYLINLCFFLYFVLLLTERSISVILSLSSGVNLFGTAFDGYVYSIVFLSAIVFMVLLILKCRPNVKALVKPNEDLHFGSLCLAGGVLLLSGMVHTHYTISGLQFASYGIWILGILLKTISIHSSSDNKPLLWLSFAYLVAFSMAIPVMYPSQIEAHVFFHALEAIGSIALVGAFTYLLIRLFHDNAGLFSPWPMILAVVIDVPLIALRWTEEINFFVLIFIVLSALLFLTGFLYKKKTVH